MYELEDRVATLEYRTSRLEDVLDEFIRSTQTSLNRLSMEMREFKEEMRAAEKRSERERREMNKKWGEISNKMGTVVEDIIFPATQDLL